MVRSGNKRRHMGWEWLPEEAHTRPYNIKIGDMENLGSTGLFFSVPSRKGMDRRRKAGKRDREREKRQVQWMKMIINISKW